MLNNRLYKLLVRRFGEGNVRVARKGQKLKGKYNNYWDEEGHRRTKLKRLASGEEYFVKCPFCRDYKTRLSVSYLFGQKDDRTGSRNIWATNCYNENCLADFNNRISFYEQVFKGVELDDTSEDLDEGEVEEKIPTLPGVLWRLDKLEERMPNHEAVLYAYERMLSPSYLGARFGVGYCPDPSRVCAENRWIVPVHYEGQFRGWTGRYIGEPESKRTPKWYHDPALPKGDLLYNFDVAHKLQTKIVVEGAGDVWGIGDPGLGLLGNKITDVQMQLLKACCREDDVLVLLLDPKQNEKERLKGTPHHMEFAFSKIKEDRHLADRSIRVYLSMDLDPGDADRTYMYRLITQVAAQAGLSVSLPKE